jgi:hypothetical protein
LIESGVGSGIGGQNQPFVGRNSETVSHVLPHFKRV